MVFTGFQVVAARSLLNMHQEELAKRAGIAKSTLVYFERGESEPRENVRQAIEKTLNELGIEFKDGGVIPRKSVIQEFHGKDAFAKLKLDVLDNLTQEGQEFLFYGANEDVANEEDKLFVETLRARKINMKFIAKKGASHSLSPKDYRFIDASAFSDNPLMIYNNKLGLLYKNPISGESHLVLIENSFFSETYTKLFYFIWNNADKR